MAFPSSHESGLIFPPPHQTHQLLPDFHCLKRSISFSGTEDGNGEDGEGCPSAAGKKRRLSLQQVRALERSFEAGVKLEPDRKLQLAAALGLQPRQIAVWFQNRRARWKTKQLEKDFEQLKLQLQALKHENDDLRDQNQKFHARLLALRNREATGPPAPAAGKLGKEAEDSWSFVTESHSEIVDVSRTPPEAAADGFRPPTASEAGFRPPESDGVACERFAAAVRDEGLIFSVIGGGVEDRLGLWSWAEQQHHHFG